jgi:hypothetical protein
MTSPTKERAAEIVAFMMKGQHTVYDLCRVMRIDPTRGNAAGRVMSWCRAFQEAGVFYIAGYTEAGGAIFAMQPSLYERDDAKPNETALAQAVARARRQGISVNGTA